MTASAGSEWQRFVILEHDHPFLHWDLLIQNQDVLTSWRLLHPVRCGEWIAADLLPDHRLMYLDYEGPVSGGRGTVQRIAFGRCRLVAAGTPTAESFDLSELHFELQNCSLATAAVCRTNSVGEPEWRFS